MPNSHTPETKATKYSAKEKDEETQYSYFGARYYHSDISVWLSVDPLADKYPSLSPFMYCAGNPVILVDPDGRNFEEWEVLLRKDGTIKVNWLSDKGGDNLQIVNFSKENSQGDHIQTAKPIALDVNKNDFKNALERNNLLAAAGQGGNQISMDASHNRIGFVPLDVGENYGAYQMANYRSNISVRGNQNQITVRATSSNTPVADGQVVFGARASLVVNGNITQTQVLANGLAVFKLPSSQNVSLTVNGGWTVRYDAGGAAVPVYHPIFWPFSLNFTDNFNLK